MGAGLPQARWHLRLLLVAALVVLASVAPPARAVPAHTVNSSSPVFTVAGAPTSSKGSTAAGAVATNAVFGLDRLAAAPDGGFVLLTFDQRVLRVDPTGRLRPLLDGERRRGYSGDGGPAVRARVGELTDVAVGNDGSIYVADSENCNVRRIGVDGVISTVVGQQRRAFPSSCRDRGDDGPGDRAELCRVLSLVATLRGSLLIATGCGLVRELQPDGVIRRVAGASRPASRRAREGEPAIRAPLSGAGMRIAALTGGETVIVEGYNTARVWLVDAAGRLRRIRLDFLMPNVEVLGAPDGSLLIAPESSGELLRRWPDGSVERLLGGRWNSAMAGIHDGDAGPLSMAPISPRDMDVAADGGLLLLDHDNVRYVAPPDPQRLALGIARESLSSRLPIELTIESTLAANATVELRVRGRLRERAAVALAPGRSTIPLANALPGELNVVKVNAVAAGAMVESVAGDRLGVVPGATLPMRVVKRIEADKGAILESIGGGRTGVRCRRFTARRIDCARYDGPCQGASAYVLRDDGVLVTRAYATRHGCRLQRQPRWSTKPHAITLPT